MISLKAATETTAILCVTAGLVLGSLVGCTDTAPSSDQRESAMPTPPIDEVLRAHTDSLMAVAGVVGVGQGSCDGSPCIRIYASEMTPAIEEAVPDTLDGYPVDVEVTGRVEAPPSGRVPPDTSG